VVKSTKKCIAGHTGAAYSIHSDSQLVLEEWKGTAEVKGGEDGEGRTPSPSLETNGLLCMWIFSVTSRLGFSLWLGHWH